MTFFRIMSNFGEVRPADCTAPRLNRSDDHAEKGKKRTEGDTETKHVQVLPGHRSRRLKQLVTQIISCTLTVSSICTNMASDSMSCRCASSHTHTNSSSCMLLFCTDLVIFEIHTQTRAHS